MVGQGELDLPLRQEIDGLQSRYLQLASGLHFKIEVTAKTRSIAKLCLLAALQDNSHGRSREGLNPPIVKDQEVMYFPSLGQGRHGTCAERLLGGQKEGAPLQAFPIGIGAGIHLGKSYARMLWRVLGQVRCGKEIRQLVKGKQRPRRTTLYERFNCLFTMLCLVREEPFLSWYASLPFVLMKQFLCVLSHLSS